jgi:hypothetical protein
MITTLALLLLAAPISPSDVTTDLVSGADALGRSLPTAAECGPPRPGRFVGVFYFLWHGPHVNGGPYDVTRILAAQPDAMDHPESKLWGPLGAPHHWGQSIFGYYLADDPWVLRKHAQMLADAGVDTVIFDVTNQLTYPHYYKALLETWSQVRAEGHPTPQVAFLCPFGQPAKVVAELWHDLYQPGLYPDLWFRWQGKPLILADPELLARDAGNEEHDHSVRLEPGHTLGQTFVTDQPVAAVAACLPTWQTADAAATLTLYRDGPGGVKVASQRFTNLHDNDWHRVACDPPQPPGRYYLELSEAQGTVGWWALASAPLAGGGQALVDRLPEVVGCRQIRLRLADGTGAGSLDNEDHDHAVRLEPGHTLGQSFEAAGPLASVAASLPTYNTTGAGATLTLYRDGPGGARLAGRRLTDIRDNGWYDLTFNPPLPAGRYDLELSEPVGTVGWWAQSKHTMPGGGRLLADGQAETGCRTIRITAAAGAETGPRSFFTFRKPQPDYFQGPTGPDQWSWLEIYPQHVFRNRRGEAEQMSVGVAQNAVGHRLGSMSEPGAMGRSFHDGQTDTSPGAVDRGLNFDEQWRRALKADPQFVFVTGWNEWFAGRFAEFAGVKRPVMFVDEYDQEHSRDCEPMVGGHRDNYYCQLVANIRRYKGVAPAPPASAARTIDLAGGFEQWATVAPEYHDNTGGVTHRDHDGWNKYARLTNDTGRNDLASAKVGRDAKNLYFYVRTAATLTPATDADWMLLFLDTDHRRETGWEGYDFVVNRSRKDVHTATLEANVGGRYEWRPVADVPLTVAGNELMLAVPRAALGLGPGAVDLGFKWADNTGVSGDIMAFYLNGDVAPNGRFNWWYRAE